MPTLDETAALLAADLLADFDAAGGARRFLAGLAGPPGSGKSTLADAVVAAIEAERPGLSAVLPMDGYHYDDIVLEALGRRPMKGAPDTFDVGGLAHMLDRLKADGEDTVAVPVFDRSIEIARAGARLIPRSTRLIVVEGNYLLLGRAPWSVLKPRFDRTILVRCTEATLRARLTERWVGFGLPPEEIARKVDVVDLPNGLAVLAGSVTPDRVVDND